MIRMFLELNLGDMGAVTTTIASNPLYHCDPTGPLFALFARSSWNRSQGKLGFASFAVMNDQP